MKRFVRVALPTLVGLIAAVSVSAVGGVERRRRQQGIGASS